MDNNRKSSPVYKALNELENMSEKQAGEEKLKDLQENRRKNSKIAMLLLTVFGVIFIAAGIYIFISGVYRYINQFTQTDWTVTEAQVTAIQRNSSHGKNRHTSYDVDYRYEADGNVYSNTIYGMSVPKELSEIFPVKYNPGAPENSTHELEPNFSHVSTGILFLVFLGFGGIFMIKRSCRSRKKSKEDTDMDNMS